MFMVSNIPIQSFAACGMASFKKGPNVVTEQTRNHSDMVNIPRIGTDNNYAFPTIQYNIGCAEKYGSGKLL
jgi:hypothetical protein